MRIKELSTIYINGKKIIISHDGLKVLDAGDWCELIKLIKEDFEKRNGFYPYSNFEASVQWHYEA